jgi:DNA-binding XRE family transcriptional regulator
MLDLKQPTPQQVKQVRVEARLTQEEAAAMVHVTGRSWQNWEAENGTSRAIPLATWELFLIKTTQPTYSANITLMDELKSDWHQKNKENIEATKFKISEIIKERTNSNSYEWLTIETRGELAENVILAWAESNGLTAKKMDVPFSSGISLIWGKTPRLWSKWDLVLNQDGSIRSLI